MYTETSKELIEVLRLLGLYIDSYLNPDMKRIIKKEFGDVNVFLKEDLKQFLFVLACADGVITYSESLFIGEVLEDSSLTPEKIEKYIKDNDIRVKSYDDLIPRIIKYYVGVDNLFYLKLGKEVEITNILIDVLEAFKFAIGYANGWTVKEINNNQEINAFFNAIRRYHDKNLKRKHVDLLVDAATNHDNGYLKKKGTHERIIRMNSVKAPQKAR